MDYGRRETECSHGDGQSAVVVAMRRVLAASVVCVCVCECRSAAGVEMDKRT